MVVVFDLDDTLYDEIEFVKSGFKEVSRYLGDKNYFQFMWNEFLKNGSGKIFNKLIEKYHLNINLQKLIEIYRFHRPNINLPDESMKLLDFSKNFKSALISDGHYITQQNKFFSLNLDKWIKYPIFTDFYHTKKPELKPFQMVMEKFKNKKYIYIADNPKKDFIAPQQLNWITIRLKNKNGVYKDVKNNAHYEVFSRNEILEILKTIKG